MQKLNYEGSKGLLLAVLALFLLALLAYRLNLPEEMPEDFTFSLTWGVSGHSTYDGETGLLVKTDDVVELSPEDFQTTLSLSKEQREQAYRLIHKMNIFAYPENYHPGLSRSDPPCTLGVTVRLGDTEKRVVCYNVGSYDHATLKGRRFLDTCWGLVEMVTATPEWKALPDYEVYYE